MTLLPSCSEVTRDSCLASCFLRVSFSALKGVSSGLQPPSVKSSGKTMVRARQLPGRWDMGWRIIHASRAVVHGEIAVPIIDRPVRPRLSFDDALHGLGRVPSADA